MLCKNLCYVGIHNQIGDYLLNKINYKHKTSNCMQIIINICQFHVIMCASFDKLYVNNQSYYLKA